MRKLFIFVVIVLIICVGLYLFFPDVVEKVQTSLPAQVVPQFLANHGELEIIHLDIGQGDATLILGPVSGGKRVSVLMDAGDIPHGGDKDGGAIVLQTLEQYGVETLDYFIASHYDADHIGGLITGHRSTHGLGFVFGENGAPGALGDDDGDGQSDWASEAMIFPDPEEFGTDDDVLVSIFVDRGDEDVPGSKTYAKYAAVVSTMGTRVTLDTQEEVDGYSIDLGDGATMTCYAASGYVRGRDKSVRYVNTENERSLCFLIEYGGFDYLLGGDTIGRKAGSENAKVERAIGEALVENSVAVDVYHVNHHGANNGSSTPFLELIQAECAIISLGDGNSYGHPHEDALKRLGDAGIQAIYQTESGSTRGTIPDSIKALQIVANGPIGLSTNGQNYTINGAVYSCDE